MCRVCHVCAIHVCELSCVCTTLKVPRQVRGGGVAQHVYMYTPGTVFDNVPRRENAGKASHSSAQPGYLNNKMQMPTALRLKRTCKAHGRAG